jgi:GH15 family glucan-1,4-alpha-glucosidase
VGYCAYDDARMLGTMAAIGRDLMNGHGLLLRYRTESGVDGLAAGEEAFLTCSFWLVEQYAHSGRLGDALRLMDTLTGYANDLGMLSEEYDCRNGRQAGNTPQALTHLTLVRAADAIAAAERPRLELP